MTRPLIGLTCYREQARWGVWDQAADLLPSAYAEAVQAAGGVPVLLPPSTPYDDAATAVLTRLDGLIISGGADVDPARYDEQPHPRTTAGRDDRDAWELALLRAAPPQLPVLGVCRGMQVMAVAAGGTLEQHVPDVVGHEGHSPGGAAFGDTTISLAPGSRLAGLLETSVPVRCHHHQAVRTHPGFEPVAWAADGLLEAIEVPGAPFRVAVQWHPEMAVDAGLFRALVEAAGATAT